MLDMDQTKKKGELLGLIPSTLSYVQEQPFFFPVDRALTNKVSNPQENLISVSKNL